MTEHSPKTAALMAYESGALSQKGRARVERHLRSCTVCQRELAAIQTYEAIVDVIRDDRGPELDWSKMELALEREAQAQAKKHRRGWMLPAAGVVLAAAAALVLALPSAGTEPTTIASSHPYVIDRTPSASTVRHEVQLARAVVTLVAGSSSIRSGASVDDASTGSALAVGDIVTTTDASSIHARIAPGLAIALERSSEMRIASLDAEAPELQLMHGRLATRVSQTRTVILAGQFRIEADIASFVIDFDEEASVLSVDVREGEVHITGPSTDARLTGPARFPDGADALEAASPVGASESYDAEPTVHVSRAGIVRWQLGDVVATGADQMSMRVGAGPLSISGWDAHGRVFRATATVGAEGLDLTPDDLRPEAPRVHQGTLAEEDIVPVVHQHMRDLQRCYEHELRTTPTLEVRVRARISIEMTGSVADEGVSYSGDPIPETMARCMTNQIQTWLFPAPDGGPVTVPIPFNFAPTGH